MLVEEKGLVVSDAIVDLLLTGTAAEYMVNMKKMDFKGHEEAAQEWGGHLTSIHSQEEQDHIKELSNKASVISRSPFFTQSPCTLSSDPSTLIT